MMDVDEDASMLGKHERDAETLAAAKKSHVDTNAITRKGVEDDFDSLLKFYYGKLFPFSKMWKWMSYGNDGLGSRREFSFTLDGDVYIRYLSFEDAAGWQNECLKRLPHKMDMGAIFSAPPKQHNAIKASEFQPEERELVFDIDLSDYDDVRTSGSGAFISEKCWQFMIAAVKVVDDSLRNDFGFQNLLWVYSGRRGVHCWVADPRARRLSNEERMAIGKYFAVAGGGKESGDGKAVKKCELRTPIHPSVRRAVKTLMPVFVNMLSSDEQGFLDSEKGMEDVLVYMPDEGIKSRLRGLWESKKTGDEKWTQLAREMRKHNNGKGKRYSPALEEIVLGFLYPRLDVHVTEQRNHLLKSPWVVHPKTGRVCVPFDPDKVADFSPEAVPTVQDLAGEFNTYAAENADMKEKEMLSTFFSSCCLKEHVQVFNKFLDGVRKSVTAENIAHAREVRATPSMSF
jgi:DNA primase small subunit